MDPGRHLLAGDVHHSVVEPALAPLLDFIPLGTRCTLNFAAFNSGPCHLTSQLQRSERLRRPR